MSFRNFLVVLLFIIILAGATGGDASVRQVGEALHSAAHWVSVAWNSMS